MAVTTQQLLDAVDAAILAIAANPTAEYEVLGERWKAHDLVRMIVARGKLASQLASEQGGLVTEVQFHEPPR